MTSEVLSAAPYVDIEDQPPSGTRGEDDRFDVDQVRQKLHEENEMVVGVVCMELAKHSASAVTHADRIVEDAPAFMIIDRLQMVWKDVYGWIWEHPIKTALLILGLGSTAFRAHEIGVFMIYQTQDFIDWSLTTHWFFRLPMFVVLMMVRLIISTLIPPTSPGFSLIIQASTPEDEKWTAMPFFLIASTIAGMLPCLMDFIFEFLHGGPPYKPFVYTNFMKRFAAWWPLTCWTEPVMRKVFNAFGGGKEGATYAVIAAHVAPFMGAQTTNLQRHFLPHPLDTILSQPFGMSEDLLAMTLAEARTNPVLASQSLTGIMAALNLLQAFVQKDAHAFFIFLLNLTVGCLLICGNMSILLVPSDHWAFAVVAAQFVVQLLVVPFCTRPLARCFGDDRDAQNDSRSSVDWWMTKNIDVEADEVAPKYAQAVL